MHLVMRPCTVSNSSRLCSRHEFVLGPRRSLRGNLIHPMHVSQSSVPRHPDLFLNVATIGFRSEINPPMLRTWLLGKEKLFVRDGHACVAYRRPNALEKLEFPTHDIHTHTTYTHTHTRRQTQARKQAHTQAYAQAPFLPPSLSLFSRSLFEAHVKSILVRIASLAS